MSPSRWRVAATATLMMTLTVACGSAAPDVGARASSIGAATPVEDAFGITIGPTTSSPGRFGPDGSGALSGLGTTSTVDTDGDGKADTFQVPVQVTVSAPGIWHITLDLSQDGELVLSARGMANLPAGPGVINVDVRGEELLFVGADGVFEATNVALSEWMDEAPRLAARVDSLGWTGPSRLRDIALPRPRRGERNVADGLSRLSSIHPMPLSRNICRLLAAFRRAVDKCDICH